MAKKKPKLAPLSRNIVRRENKNGEYYYYNKKQGKIASRDSWKSQNIRVEKRKEEIAEKERKYRQYLKRKRETAKEEEKKHRQYLKRKRKAKKTKAVPAPMAVTKKEFPSGFPFFDAIEIFEGPVFDGIKVIIDFTDLVNGFNSFFDNYVEEFPSWYTGSDTLKHLREYYNDSPHIATFEAGETDDTTFVRYTINLQ